MMNNNYLSALKVKNMFKGLAYEFKLRNIDVNGQKRGCSGFIVNTVTNKIVYIDTEPCFNAAGLYGNKNNAVMLRSAESLKDYHGGMNQWSSIEGIVALAEVITQ